MPKLTENWTLSNMILLEDEMFAINSSLLAHSKKLSKDLNIEFAEAGKKTKPKCVKGTACGFTCISGKLRCSSKILKRDADALLKNATGNSATDKTKTETIKSIETLSGEDALALASKANWAETFGEKLATKASKADKIYQDNDTPDNERAYQLADDTETMATVMEGTIAKHIDGEAEKNESLYVTKTKSGKMSGVMELAVNESSVNVTELMGHPGRLLGDKDASEYAGAGSTLMIKAAQVAIENGLPLKLSALSSAVPFYEKLGFIRDKDNKEDDVQTKFTIEGKALDKLAGAVEGTADSKLNSKPYQYDKSLSTFNAAGVERSYAGVDQGAGNSRLFMAKSIIKSDKPDEIDTFMRDQYPYHFAGVVDDDSKFSERAISEFKYLWSKTSPETRQELAGTIKNKNKAWNEITKQDAKDYEKAQEDKAKADEADYYAKKAAKKKADIKPAKDGLDDDFFDLGL